MDFQTQMEIVVKVSDLQKRFGEVKAVDGLNFEVYRNEIFGLLGPNGAGKTTTISMICGLLQPSGGSITFTKEKDRKSIIGYCPQENIFYPKLTCLEQLIFIGRMYGLPSKLINERAAELLDLLGLKDKRRVIATNLSGGMKRRLNICLALIHNPEILILDEPETGLDPQSRILVRDFIKLFGKEQTILLTTHNMDEADRLASRVAIIDHGKLLLLDTPRNLKKTVGKGDILEFVLENGDQNHLTRFREMIGYLSLDVKTSTDSIIVKHPNVIEHLPEIKNIAEKNNLIISEVRLRENTLEDVFIHLTGRKLRQ
jgi:ABC-2 type transport system ATP-binding protein